MDIPNSKLEQTSMISKLKPKLTWHPKQIFSQQESTFLKKFSKHFAQVTFNYSELSKSKFLPRIKHVKRIHSLVLNENTGLLKNSAFLKLPVRNLLRIHRRNMKQFEIVAKAPANHTPLLALRQLPHIETVQLDISSLSSATDFLYVKNLKKLYLEIKPTENTSKLLRKKLLRYLPSLKHLELFKVVLHLGQQHHVIYEFLRELEGRISSLHSLKGLMLVVVRWHNQEDLPLTEESFPDIFSRVTSLDIHSHSRLFVTNIHQFQRLTSLKLFLFADAGYKQKKSAIIEFFKSLSALKHLKQIDLKANPNNGNGSERKQIDLFLAMFSLPESVEDITLEISWFKLYEIIPYDPENLPVSDKNPLEDYLICSNFGEKWRSLTNLHTLCINLRNSIDEKFTLNWYLVFLILSRVPNVQHLSYDRRFFFLNIIVTLAPLNLGLFFKSIQHLTPSLTTLSIADKVLSLNQVLDDNYFNFPKLEELKISGTILTDKAICNFIHSILKRKEQQKSQNFILDLGRLLPRNEESFERIFKFLPNIFKGAQVSLQINSKHISAKCLFKCLCEFAENIVVHGSLFIKILEVTKLFKGMLSALNRKFSKCLALKKVNIILSQCCVPETFTFDGMLVKECDEQIEEIEDTYVQEDETIQERNPYYKGEDSGY